MTEQPRAIDEINPDGVPRTVLFVAGAGRSGTSTLAGIVSKLGMHVPLPEVPPDDSNPRGFSEPQWVVDVHDEWLREALVQVSDSRPAAWFDTGRICSREPARIRVSDWLEPHFAEHPELVVKDPRLSWFLGLWRVAAIRTGATPVFATMLRPPAEVVGSKQKYYANKLGSAHLAASWVNMLLHTERATRPAEGDGGAAQARVFVRYEDLLTDWVKTTTALGHALDLQTIIHTRSDQIREVRGAELVGVVLLLGADHLGGRAQHRREDRRGPRPDRGDAPEAEEPTQSRVLDDELGVLAEVRLEPLADPDACGLAAADPAGVVPRARTRVADLDERLGEPLVVDVDDPLRLAEAARVGVVRLDLGQRHVHAEPGDDAGERAGAAAAGAGDEEDLPRHTVGVHLVDRSGLLSHGGQPTGD